MKGSESDGDIRSEGVSHVRTRLKIVKFCRSSRFWVLGGRMRYGVLLNNSMFVAV
jgi:hypothetical protein